MYTEEYEDNSSSIKKLIIKVVIALIILIISFVLKKVMITYEYINKEGVNTNPYANATYKDNLEHINSVMLGYFDEDKLKEVKNKPYKVTVKELIDEGVLVSIVDANDKVCNSKKSYVEISPIEDKENEYILKTKLKCSKEDNYILKHLGHYNYCSDFLCEKEQVTISKKTTSPTEVIKFGNEDKLNKNIKVYPKEETPYVPEEDQTKQFEYAKTTKATFDNWSMWSGWIKTSCDTPKENCDDRDPLCRRKIVIHERDEKVKNYSHKYEAPRKEIQQATTSEIKGCNNYNYIVIDNIIYATNAVYTMVNSISSSTKSTQGNWEYKGEQSFDTPQSDSVLKIYKFVKIDFSSCKETCEGKPLKYVYDVYEFTGTLENASENADFLCKGSMSKTVALYKTTDVVDTSSRKEPVYGKVCYYNMKTRNVKTKGNTKKEFSSFNDQKLLDKNYYYTGKVKDSENKQENTQKS